ncbi:hypothetical protein Vadar_018182 [Vaccinium darrowii]|uniref:Uncharacterized protein n=1 Tax=Vaccinium darrowii TaxID=229202 RepID=A0ACB7YMU0_9ERIC|nr:hypothetical protein Vadar_018182 [Vaccinium darrowii]
MASTDSVEQIMASSDSTEVPPSRLCQTPTIINSTKTKSKCSIRHLLSDFKAKFCVSKPKSLEKNHHEAASSSATTHQNDNHSGAISFCSKMISSDLLLVDLALKNSMLLSDADLIANWVALQFVHEMQCKAQKNFDASRDRSLLVFGVGFAFINESTIYLVSSQQLDDAIEDMKLVSNLTPPRKVFHVIPTASIYSSDLGEGKVRLKELVNNVSDAAGKEDLMLHLRMLSLQNVQLLCMLFDFNNKMKD